MDFPIVDLMNRAACMEWIQGYFHPDGLKCPFVEQFTKPEATLYTDEYDSYNRS